MALFSKQKWFCNACAKYMFTTTTQAIGNKWRTCSIECHREMEWRDVLSTMGEEYRPMKEEGK